jgi:hypothetical protein
MAFWQWSETATSNATADPTINWSSGIPPSLVAPNARAMMAGLAAFRDDTSGLLATSGTSTAYTLTTNQGLPSTPNDGQLIVFSPHVANGAAATLQADGGTAFPLQSSPGTALASAALTLGVPVAAKFKASSSAWIMFGAATTGVANGVAIGSVTGAGIANSTITGTNLSANLDTLAIGFQLGDAVDVITTGVKQYLPVPFNCTIVSWTVVSNANGLVCDIWRANGALPTSSAQSIVGSLVNAPQSGGSTYTHAVPTSWTSTSFAAGDVLVPNVTSSSVITLCNVTLNVTKN